MSTRTRTRTLTGSVLVVLLLAAGMVVATGSSGADENQAGQNCGWSTTSDGTSYQSVHEERTREDSTTYLICVTTNQVVYPDPTPSSPDNLHLFGRTPKPAPPEQPSPTDPCEGHTAVNHVIQPWETFEDDHFRQCGDTYEFIVAPPKFEYHGPTGNVECTHSHYATVQFVVGGTRVFRIYAEHACVREFSYTHTRVGSDSLVQTPGTVWLQFSGQDSDEDHRRIDSHSHASCDAHGGVAHTHGDEFAASCEEHPAYEPVNIRKSAPYPSSEQQTTMTRSSDDAAPESLRSEPQASVPEHSHDPADRGADAPKGNPTPTPEPSPTTDPESSPESDAAGASVPTTPAPNPNPTPTPRPLLR